MEQPIGQTSAATPEPAATRAGAAVDLSGQTLGDYQILRKLGEGGMGQVFLAEQMSLKRKVALKLLRADLSANSTALDRFKQEALAVAQATHANIVQVYDIKQDPATGFHYMALEYVEGRNLRQFLEKKGPPELLLALSIIRQVASALQRATELGIVHRDIKPENILLTRKGEVKVADFGLSRFFGEDSPALNLTQTGITLGTPLYMSPEQVEGKKVDPRTDIYSFGVTCYHLLSGHPPFRGTSAFDVAVQHVQKQPVPLAQIRPDLPAELCALVHRMMAKKPEDRIQTGREIVREVARLRDSLVASGALTPGGASGSSGDTAHQSFVIQVGPGTPDPAFDAAVTQSVPRLNAHRWLPWAAVLSVFLAVCAGLSYGWSRSRATSALANTDSHSANEEPQLPIATPEVSAEEKRQLDYIHLLTLKSPKVEPQELLQRRMDLGLYYLKEWRLDDAEKTFRALEDNAPAKAKLLSVQYGRLGMAMVLAFRNEHKASNDILAKSPLLGLGPKGKGDKGGKDAKDGQGKGGKDGKDGQGKAGKDAKDGQGKAGKEPFKGVKAPPSLPAVLSRPELAEMLAKALHYNFVNSPSTFPPALRVFLVPPVPPLPGAGKQDSPEDEIAQ